MPIFLCIKKNIRTRLKTLLPFLWLERKKSTHKVGINFNNHICQGHRVHLWQGRKCDAAECYVTSLSIFDCVWMKIAPTVNAKHNGIQPIMHTPSQMTRGAFGVCHSQTLIVAVLPPNVPKGKLTDIKKPSQQQTCPPQMKNDTASPPA